MTGFSRSRYDSWRFVKGRQSQVPGGEDVAVGDGDVARDFFAGRYAKILDSVDAAGDRSAPADVAFIVGAFAFLGRVDEAESYYQAYRSSSVENVRTDAAVRLFLGVGRARAGDFARSRAWLVEGARARTRVADPWARALVFQGLAAHRYFTGRYRAAARHALRALRAAHASRFAYAQMLSTDLRGHALVQLGALEAGTALLDQARTYAERVGFELNAHAIACSIAIYRAKFRLGADVVAELNAILGLRRQHDSYSERMVRTALAIQYALRGRASDAVRELERADADALRVDARRAKVASLLARLHVTRFRSGARAAADILDDVSALTDRGDVAFRAELLAMEAHAARSLGDEARFARALASVRAFLRHAQHHLATSTLALEHGVASDAHRFFAEDEISPVLAAAASHDARELPRLIALGILGPIPEMLGLTPGRRVMFFERENFVLLEDRGDLVARASPPRWVAPLLRALAGGGASKEAIVAELWGLRRYNPERHDSLVRTTIHRLRALLEPRGEWVVVTPTGYGIDAEILFFGRAPGDRDPDRHLLDLSLDDGLEPHPHPSPVQPATADVASLEARVLALVASGIASAPEIAKAAGVSESTALRALRRLVDARAIVRRGAARATRYSVRTSTPRARR